MSRKVFVAIQISSANMCLVKDSNHTMKDIFISSEGCIGRIAFTIRIIVLALITLSITRVAINYFDHWHHGNYSPLGPFVGIVVAVFCLLISLMQFLKRLRDMGKPAYWSLLMFVPGINLLLLVYMALAPGKMQ